VLMKKSMRYPPFVRHMPQRKAGQYTGANSGRLRGRGYRGPAYWTGLGKAGLYGTARTADGRRAAYGAVPSRCKA
jgi:hypothetical protein